MPCTDKKELREIVTIKSGVFAKGDLNPDIYYIQATDFDKNRAWTYNLSPVLRNSSSLRSHILRTGDILFAAKGKEIFAVVYDGSYYPAVASTTFFVLQVQRDDVRPEFVAWYLNHPKTQLLLKGHAKGTDIKSITISILGDIEISVPDFTKQLTILELFELQKKEKILQDKISKLRQEYINEITYKALQ